ncbi:MAG: hypothetical protein IPO27_13845 [Bacteroidetes bacterium]|nr:hypothetical protein [Bacteroidota bacterium]
MRLSSTLSLKFLVLLCLPAAAIFAQEARISLNGTWKFKPTDSLNYYQATVPGSVYVDWQANGFIDNLFSPAAEQELAWMENTNWEYEREFDASAAFNEGKFVQLICEGIDTYAELYLNDARIGETKSMFLKYEFDCKSYLKEGKNKLKVLIKSPVAAVVNDSRNKFIYPADNDKHPHKTSAYTRKAGYQYGWDFAPRFAAGGVWKDIYLLSTSGTSIESVTVRPVLKDSTLGDFYFTINLREPIADAIEIDVTETNGFCGRIHKAMVVESPQSVYRLAVPVKDPRVWNSWERGVPFRYRFNVVVKSNKDSATYSVTAGFNAVSFESHKDNIGSSFRFVHDGEPIFIRGANWVPLSMFPGVVTDSVYDAYFRTARVLNINMLRVWGGGIYERDYFYECADKYGILIWQDFMFGGTLYPSDKGFVDRVTQEVKYQVQRLAHHPCIALWCGNNEIDVAIKNWGWQQSYSYDSITWLQLRKDYKDLFEKRIDSILKRNASGASYVHTSPLSNWGKQEDFLHFDNHYWGVWHGELPFSSFYEKVPRFCSEYGMQSFPDATLIPEFLNSASNWQSENIETLATKLQGQQAVE